jgi:hypothetical protein
MNDRLKELQNDYDNAIKRLDGDEATKIRNRIYDLGRRSSKVMRYEIMWVSEFADEAINPEMKIGAAERIAELESILYENTRIRSDFTLKTLQIKFN